MTKTVLVALAAGLLLAADKPAGDGASGELKKFTGTWHAVSIERDGKKVPKEEVDKVHLMVQGHKYTLKSGDHTIAAGAHKLDPSRSPKQIDAVRSDGEHKGQTMKGIYELTEDTFKVCFGEPGKGRPTEFSSKEGGGHRVIVMKRAKR